VHILLYGPSGSGKSTVGRLLAEQLAMPFCDLDEQVEKRCGKPIPAVMAGEGQAYFRKIETEVLQGSLSGAQQIIALGGGSLLLAENRALAEAAGQVVYLDTAPPELARRLAQDANRRPLLAGDLTTSLENLLHERKSHYASFTLRVNADAAPAQVAEAIQRCLGRFHLRAMGAPYDVLVRAGGLDEAGRLLEERGCQGPIALVSDEQVAPLYAGRVLAALQAADYVAHEIIIPVGEAHKTIDTVMTLWRAFLQAGLERGSTVLALGGGVVSDLAGFAAAAYMRGCAWAAFPTTLLAMVDAALGGKTGCDLPEGKNLIGAFHPPRLVLSDLQVLTTLPAGELRAGLAETLKHGVIADPELFNLCAQGYEAVSANLPEVVRRAAAVKIGVIERDPYEKDLRASLNFGHTIGHALEQASAYRLRHGEAVAIGMLVETRLAERLGIASRGLADAIQAALVKLGLPVEIPADLPRADILRALTVDKKKSGGKVKFALPEEIGRVRTGLVVDDLERLIEEV